MWSLEHLTRDKQRNREIVLTAEQAETWLRMEPAFPKPIAKRPPDDSYHSNSPDEDVTDPKEQKVTREERCLEQIVLSGLHSAFSLCRITAHS
jgi:hypothetical protein